MNLSATQLKLYKECRLRYYRQYIQKAPRKENTAALLGIGLHKAIAEYYNGKNPRYVFQKELRNKHNQWLEQNKQIDYVYDLQRAEAKGMEFIDRFPFEEFSPRYCEMPFNIPLFKSNHRMRGFIDMITDSGDIIDFKTSSKMPAEITSDIQFTVYIHAYYAIYQKMPQSAQWYHIRNNKRRYYDLDQYEYQWGEIEKLIEQLEVDNFEDLQVCDNCPFYCSEKQNATNFSA